MLFFLVSYYILSLSSKYSGLENISTAYKWARTQDKDILTLNESSKQILISPLTLRASPAYHRDGWAVMEIEERHLVMNEIR